MRSALVRDFGRDAVQQAGAEVGTPAPAPTPDLVTETSGRTVTVPVAAEADGRDPRERGWQLAHWAVANASALHIERVSYAGREWTAGRADSRWRTAAGGAQSADRAEGAAAADAVRIVTAQ
ncbi:hypothetical protein GCM10020295_27940 [Streptomyces cinereospinus]